MNHLPIDEWQGWRDQTEPSPLTKREVEILDWLAKGYSSKEVAQKLGLGFETVKSHSKHIRHKLQARNTAHAVAIALIWELI